MAFIGQTLRASQLNLPQRKSDEESSDVTLQRLNKGMISSIDPSDVPDDAFVSAINCRNRFDRTSRRSGHSLLNIAAPDANQVNKLIRTKLLGGNTALLRVTASAIHRLGISSWLPITGTPALIGNQIDSATIFDRILVSDAVNPVMYIKDGAIEAAPEAPIAKFVTGFFNRGIAAFIMDGGIGSITVAWTGEYTPGDNTALKTWNFSENISAGFEPLIDSPADTGDPITGIKGSTNVLFIAREKTLWLANKQGSASSPFRFYAAVPGLGCDCSYSIEVTRGGFCFADTRTRAMWVFMPGAGFPERISVNIETDLFAKLGQSIDPTLAFSSFDAHLNEYHLQVPDGSTTRHWVYNFDTKSFAYDENAFQTSVTARVCTDTPIVINTTIAELVGKISGLVGKIISLNNPRNDQTSMYVGLATGEVLFEAAAVDDDNGTLYNTIWDTKDFTVQPDYAVDLRKILLESNVATLSSIQLSYSLDNGVTWIVFRDYFDVAAASSRVSLAFKNILGRRIRLRITARSGRIALLKANIDITRGGLLSDGSTGTA